MTTPVRVASWPLPALAGQMQLGSLVMGAGTPYSIQQIEGLDLPEITTADSDRAGTDGSFGGVDQTTKRMVIAHMLIHPDTVGLTTNKGALSRALKAAFQESQVDVGLTYVDPDLGGLLIIGRPRRCSYVVDRQYPFLSQDAVLAQFDGLEPLLYGAVLNDQVIPYGTAGTNAGIEFYGGGLAGMRFPPPRLVQNGMFEEASTAPWLTTAGGSIAGGATLTRDVGTVHDGTAAGKVVTNGASTNEGIRQTSVRNARPNTTYTLSAWVQMVTAGGVLQMFLSDDNEAISTFAQTAVVGSWVQLTATVTTSANPTTLSVYVRDTGTAVTRTFYVDSAQIEVAAAPGPVLGTPLIGATAGAIGGGGGAAGFATCVNNGDENFLPVSRIVAGGSAVTGPLHLQRVESAEDIVLNYNMQPNDILELDHDLHTVTLNGVANRSDVIDGSTAWWVMQPGSQTIHFRTEGPGAGSYAEVKWRDAYW